MAGESNKRSARNSRANPKRLPRKLSGEKGRKGALEVADQLPMNHPSQHRQQQHRNHFNR